MHALQLCCSLSLQAFKLLHPNSDPTEFALSGLVYKQLHDAAEVRESMHYHKSEITDLPDPVHNMSITCQGQCLNIALRIDIPKGLDYYCNIFHCRTVMQLMLKANVQDLLSQKMKEGTFPVRKEALFCLKNLCNGMSPPFRTFHTLFHLCCVTVMP